MALILDSDTRPSQRVKTRRLPVQPGATFVKGQIVIWTPTGLAGPPAAGTNYGAGGWTANNRIAGKALSGSIDARTNAAAAFADVEIAEPGIEFPLPLVAATSAAAVAALAQLGNAGYELKAFSLNGLILPAVDLTQAGTANAAGIVVDFVPSTGGVLELPNWPENSPFVTPNTANGSVWFEFKASACAFSGAR